MGIDVFVIVIKKYCFLKFMISLYGLKVDFNDVMVIIWIFKFLNDKKNLNILIDWLEFKVI